MSNTTLAASNMTSLTSGASTPVFVAILPIMSVLGIMFGTTVVVIILVSLWPRKKRRRRRRGEDIPMDELDSVYAELDNKSVSTTMTRVTSEYSLDSEIEAGAYNNPAFGLPNGSVTMEEKGRTGNNKKVRFSEHQVEIPLEPNGRPRSKLYIDVR